ncbi:Hypothetical predicted protein [Paramuricea clavata]|uniref:Uncharacterized protein n=1 Tax=Paramuricea clavata TaxID=317549 RepID=A0A6S7JMN6_PARCT|nr:Hypothetical predicted protein [Paramuricea clavata]
MLRQQKSTRSIIFARKVRTVGVGYQRDSKTYKHKNGIPKPIVELVEPIFDDLADPALLKKCTHGLTQNPNECLNGIIWDRCPKTTYVEQETVALATYLAVLKFNDGDISYLKILEDLDITPGFFTCKGGNNICIVFLEVIIRICSSGFICRIMIKKIV